MYFDVFRIQTETTVSPYFRDRSTPGTIVTIRTKCTLALRRGETRGYFPNNAA